jgi:RHS repeat-associated protein
MKGAGGNLLLRYTGDSNSRSFVPFNGRLLAEYYCGGMIFDHPDEIGSATTATDCTGNLVNEKLYYPFGEFWTGYALPNLGMHQEFAQLPDYDPETDQYNTLARHYSPSGRWLSPDPGGVKVVHLDDPQTWNMYAYVRNNPTTLTDPTGLYICGSSMTDSQCDSFAQSLTDAQNAANNIKNEYGSLSAEYLNSQRAIDAYGGRGVDNGVTIQVGDLPSGEGAETMEKGTSAVTADNPNGQNISVTFNTKTFNDDAGSAALAVTSAHEGSHVADASDWVSSGFDSAMKPTSYATESKAFGVSAAIAEGSGAYPNGLTFGSSTIWQPMWGAAQVQQGIDQFLAAPGLYHVTPFHPGSVNWSKRTGLFRWLP